ncbi:Endogenous retrovirus group K member 8 Pol protein, partial [Spheniscus humboldti]
FISEANARADRLAAPAWTVPVPDVSTQARLSHEFFHQSAQMLRRQFGLTWDTAQSIVQMCPDCQGLAPIPQTGVNPQGEKALQIWQSDVTHIGEFGRQKYVHVSIDTFSGALWVTAE